MTAAQHEDSVSNTVQQILRTEVQLVLGEIEVFVAQGGRPVEDGPLQYRTGMHHIWKSLEAELGVSNLNTIEWILDRLDLNRSKEADGDTALEKSFFALLRQELESRGYKVKQIQEGLGRVLIKLV